MKPKHASAPPVSSASKSVLSRFRRPWAVGLQLTALLGLILHPVHHVSARYVPDGNGQPVWEREFDANGNETVFEPNGADTGDDDGDLLLNWWETYAGTDPLTPDTDGDGLTDRDEVQTTSTNPLLWDTSGDGFSDSENHFGLGDPNGDLDGDGLNNALEQANDFDMRDTDSNDDGVSDYDQYYAIDNANSDVDGDGLTYQEEQAAGTHFLQADTDNDGFNDGVEVAAGSNPLVAADNPNNLGWNVDSDGDGLSNYAEMNVHFSNPNNTDTDGDGVQDGMEVLVHGCNPTVVDSDGDGLPDGYELGVATAFRNGEIPVIFTSPATPDSDADGLDDDFETNAARYGDHPSDPWLADSDGDRLADGFEVLITLTFPDDSDSDDDGIGDFEDAHAGQADTDGDGISDSYETGVYLTNPQVADTDGDGLSDGAEVGLPTPATYATDPRLKDTDGDGLEDGFELTTSLTDPRQRDTNGDGLSDKDNFHGTDSRDQDNDGLTNDEEIAQGTGKLVADTDGDGLSDGYEVKTSHTGPLLADTDSDGLDDAYEISHSYTWLIYYTVFTSPLDDDSDDDGLTDGQEVHTSLTEPTRADTDGDGLNDSEELLIYSTNPLNAHTLSALYGDYYMVSLTDTDSGGIPDRIESFYGMDPNTSNDDLNGDLDGDHIKNIDAFIQGWSLLANYNQLFDNDGDGMTDAWEVFHGLNPHDTTDRGGDPDHDWICNQEEFRFGTNPQVPDDFESVLGYALQLVLFNGRSLVWSASGTADWDGDLKSNEYEMAIGSDPRTYQAPISNSGGGGGSGEPEDDVTDPDADTANEEGANIWEEAVYTWDIYYDTVYVTEMMPKPPSTEGTGGSWQTWYDLLVSIFGILGNFNGITPIANIAGEINSVGGAVTSSAATGSNVGHILYGGIYVPVSITEEDFNEIQFSSSHPTYDIIHQAEINTEWTLHGPDGYVSVKTWDVTLEEHTTPIPNGEGLEGMRVIRTVRHYKTVRNP